MINWSAERLKKTITLNDDKAVEILYENPTKNFNTILLLCHPHPLFDGSMYNKIIAIMARTAHSHGVATLRFNFSSVGLTSGPFISIKHEVFLVNQLIAILKESLFEKYWLGGFSFGASTLLLSEESDWPRILIAPSWRLLEPLPELNNFKDIMILQSLNDEIVEARKTWEHFNSIKAGDKKLIFYGEGGHFLQEKLALLKTDLSVCYQQLILKSGSEVN
jgi:alpha/beta superfamily hydrolase